MMIGKRTKPNISELYGMYDGFSVAVCGGAESLADDLSKLPIGTKIISANQHCYLLGIVPDFYVVFHEFDILMKYWNEPQGAIRISKRPNLSDFSLDGSGVFDRGFTGHVALWLACQLTDSDVIICGMDCYSGVKPYFHDQKRNVMPIPIESYKDQWKDAKSKSGVRNPERVYAMSGVLTKVFNQYPVI